jgi:hypothetical protein
MTRGEYLFWLVCAMLIGVRGTAYVLCYLLCP